MSKLVIVESPAKAKTIGKYLGAGYVVKASMGHLRDLPKKKMSIDFEHDFKPEYVPIEGKEKIIKEIRSEIRKSDFVYLATDPDREGEAISWHIKELFKLKDKDSKRVTFNEITKQAVKYGIDNPRDIDIDLVNAQQARRILDRIVGYELSPFLWRKVKRGLSAGRVQSVATRLVVDRENEIRAFVPEEYWTIEALLQTADGGQFTARYYGDQNGKAELKNEEQAQAVVNAVSGKPFAVGEIKRGKKKRTPAPPFITSTLQQEASRKLNMTPRRTMSIAQELYEGIELGEYGLTGLITYMRTDSLRLADEATAAAAGFIRGRYGEEYYPGKPRVFKTKGNAQDAHEAIRPSDVKLLPDEIRQHLTPDQYKLYKLIWSRFVACQMADAILDTVSADIVCEGQVFRASGHTVAFPGFTAVYEEGTDDEKKGEAGKPLPRFDKGDTLSVEKLDPAHHIDAVESKLFGIGAESYTVGSNEFYMGYATSRQTALCLDAGHFHPTEVISDKISAAMLYIPRLLLHVSRPVRWDSDHVVLLDDETQAIASEIIRHNLFDRVHIGLDFFDASINRIAAWVIGTRNMKKALLRALLEPTAQLRQLENDGDYTARLALLEEQKSLPWQAIWEMYCQRHDTPAGSQWLDNVRAYENAVLSQRG